MTNAEVMMAAAVVVEVGGMECEPGTYGVEEGRVQLSGDLQKPAGFLDQNAANSSGTARSVVQQPPGFLDQNAPQEALPRTQALTQVATGDDRATTLGIGNAAQPTLDKGGRPRTLTPVVAEQLCMLVAIGFNRKQAAAYLGFSPSTIANEIKRNPALGEELARAEQLADLQPELTVMAEARKNWKAASWYLEFKKRNPRPLTREEKEERHREALEDNRREAERSNAFCRDLLSTPLSPARSQEPPARPVKTRSKRRAK